MCAPTSRYKTNPPDGCSCSPLHAEVEPAWVNNQLRFARPQAQARVLAPADAPPIVICPGFGNATVCSGCLCWRMHQCAASTLGAAVERSVGASLASKRCHLSHHRPPPQQVDYTAPFGVEDASIVARLKVSAAGISMLHAPICPFTPVRTVPPLAHSSRTPYSRPCALSQRGWLPRIRTLV